MESDCGYECWDADPGVLRTAQAIVGGMSDENRRSTLEALKGKQGKYVFVSGEAGRNLQVAVLSLSCAVCLLGFGLRPLTQSTRRRVRRF